MSLLFSILRYKALIPRKEPGRTHTHTQSYVSHHQTSKHQCTRLGSVPNLNSQASSPLARDKSLHIKFENRRRDVISLNQPRGKSKKMSAKMAFLKHCFYICFSREQGLDVASADCFSTPPHFC